MDSYDFAEVTAHKGAPLLLLFHGTGGDENNLVDLGRQLMPDAHIISPRGDVSEGGALSFFRRTGEGVFDMADLARATGKMIAFVEARVAAVQPQSISALGYSNGANILASLLFNAPQLIGKAVLMHPLIPFDPPAQPALARKNVLITAGRLDPMASVSRTQRLADYFTAQGAGTELFWHEGGHEIRQAELVAARAFLATP